MASLFKRGSTWWGKVERAGRVRRNSLKTASKEIARKRLARWVAKLDGVAAGDKAEAEDHTFGEAVTKFTDEHLPTLKKKSATRYDVSIDALLRSIEEDLPVRKIGTATLTKLVADRRADGVKAPTIRRDLACLSSILGMCIEWEWLDAHPVGGFLKRMKKRGLRESAARTRYLSQEEEAKVLAHATKRAREAIIAAIDSGMRKEEQFSREWPHLDLAKSEWHADGSTSKNSRERKIPVLPRSKAILEAMPRHITVKSVFWHRAKTGKERGKVRRYTTMDRALKAACRRAGVNDVRWHDLRRTCGCRLLQVYGMSMEQVSAWLGHSSVKVTERIYSFLEIDQLHEAAGTKTVTVAKSDA